MALLGVRACFLSRFSEHMAGRDVFKHGVSCACPAVLSTWFADVFKPRTLTAVCCRAESSRGRAVVHATFLIAHIAMGARRFLTWLSLVSPTFVFSCSPASSGCTAPLLLLPQCKLSCSYQEHAHADLACCKHRCSSERPCLSAVSMRCCHLGHTVSTLNNLESKYCNAKDLRLSALHLSPIATPSRAAAAVTSGARVKHECKESYAPQFSSAGRPHLCFA